MRLAMPVMFSTGPTMDRTKYMFDAHTSVRMPAARATATSVRTKTWRSTRRMAVT